MRYKLVISFIVNFLCSFITTNEINVKGNLIDELEKQKSELYKQINKEIDDSVTILRNINDTDSLLTMENMKDLKNQIKILNGTDKDGNVVDDKTEIGEFLEDLNYDWKKTRNSSDVRRSNLGAILSSKNKDIKLDLHEVAMLLKQRGKKVLNKEMQNQYNAVMQKKLESWMHQREIAKEKWLEEKRKRLRKFKFEKCPRQGSKRVKDKSRSRRRNEDEYEYDDSQDHRNRENGTTPCPEERKPKKKSRVMYPCCRKCCKKSYLGCL
jgi:hypothetical protein